MPRLIWMGGVALACVVVGACTQSPLVISEPPPARPYTGGQTDYGAGKAFVTQPSIYSTPDRSFDGFRVAGIHSDLVVGYWDDLHAKLVKEGRGTTTLFELFRKRHRDLQVYQTGAADAVLREFRLWAEHRKLGMEFKSFWGS